MFSVIFATRGVCLISEKKHKVDAPGRLSQSCSYDFPLLVINRGALLDGGSRVWRLESVPNYYH